MDKTNFLISSSIFSYVFLFRKLKAEQELHNTALQIFREASNPNNNTTSERRGAAAGATAAVPVAQNARANNNDKGDNDIVDCPLPKHERTDSAQVPHPGDGIGNTDQIFAPPPSYDAHRGSVNYEPPSYQSIISSGDPGAPPLSVSRIYVSTGESAINDNNAN